MSDVTVVVGVPGATTGPTGPQGQIGNTGPKGDTGPAGPALFPAHATVDRPSAGLLGAGSLYYDTTVHKPAWSDGTVWRDATGTTI